MFSRLRKIIEIMIFLNLWIMAMPAPAVTTYYVATNGNDGASGLDWGSSLLTISNALGKAAAGGDTIMVSNGTYVLTTNLYVNKAVTIRGVNGYSNTIVNGNYPGTSNRCFYIISNATLSGFTITNGYCTNDYGGGIYMTNGTVTNCLITGNICWNKNGGGVYLKYGTLSHCLVVGNVCTGEYNTNPKGGGGGIFVTTMGKVVNCVVSCNQSGVGTTDGGGGGINSDVANLMVYDCLISNNYSLMNGGGVFQSSLSNCSIVNNSAVSKGGGAWNDIGGSMLNCTFSNNTAASGGGMYCYKLTVSNCVFRNNSATGGGGISFYLVTAQLLQIYNSLFFGNAGGASGGGGLNGNSGSTSTGVVYCCTIVSNTASGGGNGIYLANAGHWVYNCIIVSNGAPETAIGLTAVAVTNNFYNNCYKSSAYVFPPSQGNITNDPQFVEWSNGNYRLSRNSPCINTGVNQDWMSGALDLDGHRRIDEFSGIVDMGCFEYLFSGMMVTFP
jgi:hypothetical protein